MKRLFSVLLSFMICVPFFSPACFAIGNGGIFVNGNMVTMGPLRQVVGASLYGFGIDADGDGVVDSLFPYTGGLTIGGTNERVTFTTYGGYIEQTADEVIYHSGRFKDPQGIVTFNYYDPDIDDTESYTISVADGKAGWGTAYLGVEHACFTFTSAGVVTLREENSSANVSTTNDTDASLNVYDGGTSVVVENQLGDNQVLFLEVKYVD